MNSYNPTHRFPYYVLDTFEKYEHANEQARILQEHLEKGLIKPEYIDKARFELDKLTNSLLRYRNLYIENNRHRQSIIGDVSCFKENGLIST